MHRIMIMFSIASFCSLAHANTSTRYCFYQETNIVKVKNDIADLLIIGDDLRLLSDDHCLEIEVNENRRDLISTYIRKKYKLKESSLKNLNNYSSSNQNCRIEIVKQYKLVSNKKEKSVGKKNRLKDTDKDVWGKTTTQMLVGSGNKSSLKINDDEVLLTCLSKGFDRYELLFSLNSNNSSLSSNIEIKSNVEVDLGSIVSEIKDKDNSISTQKGVSTTTTSGSEDSRYSLIIR